MVQVSINLELAVDFHDAALVPGTYRGRIQVCTAQGDQILLHDFEGVGSAEEAQESALRWVRVNLTEQANPWCRTVRYSKKNREK